MITEAHVTVGTTATKLADGPGTVYLAYDTAGNVFLGGSTVTTGTGYHLGNSSDDHSYPVATGDSLYGIVASGTTIIHVLVFT